MCGGHYEISAKIFLSGVFVLQVSDPRAARQSPQLNHRARASVPIESACSPEDSGDGATAQNHTCQDTAAEFQGIGAGN